MATIFPPATALKPPALKSISRLLALAGLLARLGGAHNALAHAPFDCSTRVILLEDTAEVTITTGPILGETFLRQTQLKPSQLPMDHPFQLRPEVATNFFVVTANGKILQPRNGSATIDSLETQFYFTYPTAGAHTLALEATFLSTLPAPASLPLVLTDENANILGSAILTPGKSHAEFVLPGKKIPPPTAVEAVAPTATPIVATKPSPSFTEFLQLGVRHILTGYDHLLFLLALLLGCRRLKPMLLVITGFTAAHSLTLALAALNLMAISPRIIEPAIAASIILVAAENFRLDEKSWQRYALTCGFGLIHGFGFASALRDSGLAGRGGDIVKPLFAFNLGVEIGQLTVAAVVLPLLFGLWRWPWFQRWGVRVFSAGIMLVATWWLVVRIANSGE